jgi:diguanylate cyclase (GGDEF)-like protein
MEEALEFLERQPRGLLLTGTLLILVGISILDYITGLEITFSFFYLLPISLVAWLLGRKEGVFLSVASALTWTLVNQIFRDEVSGLLLSYWNAGSIFSFFLIVTLLVSEVRLLLEKERLFARTDFLTGALNRRAFYETSKFEILRVKRTSQPFSIIYIDIDAFKAINDSQGHHVGDTVLRLVTETISSNIRSCDMVGRLGGDEFAVLLPGANHTVAKSITPRLQKILMEKMLEKRYPVTFSMGVITYRTPPEDVETMLKLADQMLYRVKNAGKNAIEYAEHTA